MSRTLERLAWRFRHGWGSEERLRRALRAGIERLTTERIGLAGSLGELRRWSPSAVADLDGGLLAAQRGLDLCDYERAVRSLRRAGRAERALRRLLAAAERLERTRQRRDDLVASLRLQRLGHLPTLAVLERLLVRAGALLERSEPRQAEFVTAYLDTELTKLEARSEAAGETRSTGPPLEERSALVGELRSAGYLNLAERLADEIAWEDALAWRREQEGAWKRRVVSELSQIGDRAAAAARNLDGLSRELNEDWT